MVRDRTSERRGVLLLTLVTEEGQTIKILTITASAAIRAGAFDQLDGLQTQRRIAQTAHRKARLYAVDLAVAPTRAPIPFQKGRGRVVRGYLGTRRFEVGYGRSALRAALKRRPR